jgi:hypothetical protein
MPMLVHIWLRPMTEHLVEGPNESYVMHICLNTELHLFHEPWDPQIMLAISDSCGLPFFSNNGL